jgi:DHA1 family bicyclomycin/chloramphenicol resistance-like MFS transporter
MTKQKNPDMSGLSFTLLLGTLTALTALSIDLNLPALPQLGKTFNANVATVQLTLSLFLLGFGLGQLVCGPISDRVGRRPVLLGGLVIFTLAGFLCAFSPSLKLLILGRFVQGVGASVGPVIARAIVRDRFDPQHAAMMLSQMAQVMIIAPLVAPLLGGYILVWYGWPTIFLVLGFSGLLVSLICCRSLPETLSKSTDMAFPGSTLWRDARLVLSHPTTLRHILTSMLSGAGIFAYICTLPNLLEDMFHAGHINVGYVFLPTSAALMAGATLNRALLARHTPGVILRYGTVCILLGGIMTIPLAWLQLGGLPGLVLPVMLYMVGVALVHPNAMALAMAPHNEYAGMASSVIGTVQTCGSAVAGYGVGLFYNNTSFPLALTMASLALASFLVRVPHAEQSQCPPHSTPQEATGVA